MFYGLLVIFRVIKLHNGSKCAGLLCRELVKVLELARHKVVYDMGNFCKKKLGGFLGISDLICFAILIAILMFSNEPNEHHEWLKKRDWPAVRDVMLDPDLT